MSKITNVRLPNTISPSYDAGQINQIVRSVEQIVLTLNSTYGSTVDENISGAGQWFGSGGGAAGGGFAGGTRGFQTSHGILLPYGMFVSSQDQSNASITQENLITYNVTAVSSGIEITNNSRIKFSCSGQYLVTFSIQFTNRGNAEQVIEVWAKNTGSNYPLSNTRYDIPARKSGSVYSHIVATVTGIFTVNNPVTEYLEIAWWASSTDIYMEHYAAGTSPTRPEIPSVILTANLISATGGSGG